MARPLTTSYDEQHIQEGLYELAMSGGNAAEASRRLASRGIEIPGNAINRWGKETYAKRYNELRIKIQDQIGSQLASYHEDTALLAAQKAREAIASLDLKQLENRDIGQAIRNLSTSAGIHTDNAFKARGKPTEVVEHRHAIDVLHRLKQINPSLVVDGTVVEPKEIGE